MLSEIRSLPAYSHLLKEILDGVRFPGLGLIRSARLPILAALFQDLDRPVFFITDRSSRGLTQYDELGFWNPGESIHYFPGPTPLFYENASWGSATRRERLLCLTMLASFHGLRKGGKDNKKCFVAPIRSVMVRTLPRRDFLKNTLTIKQGQDLHPQALLKTWSDLGYEYSEVVLTPGQISRRGGLLDIWPPADESPLRLDFFGNEIETIRQFDPSTQRSLRSLEQISISPAREFILSKAEEIGLATEKVDEYFIPVIHPLAGSVLDYLPQNALIVFDDLDRIRTQAEEVEERAFRMRNDFLKEGIIPEDFPIPYVSWSELFDSLNSKQWIELGRTTASEDTEFSKIFTPGPRFAGRLKQVMGYVKDSCLSGDRVVVVSRQVARLNGLWDENKPDLSESESPGFIEGTLSEGWVLDDGRGKRFHLLTDAEVFGWERPKPRTRSQQTSEAPEAGYSDLAPGNWVVHIDYGIGRYIGLVNRFLDGTQRDFLLVEYDCGDQLFVPVHQADRLSRFIGPNGETPSPTRLGTNEWVNTKQRVSEAVKTIALELLELYVKRQVAKGFTFSKDTPWQQELEASFSYIETKDQLQAIRDVKRDMENYRPMDRLLCGDVGYGKTEVALRAAFKAVMDGKQVAILVPTTVLAQQHYDTFQQRLAAYPVEIEMLSRFRNPKEQEKILKLLQQGSLDIVIGTHRLVQSDVQFSDLGLVIIDEEQRFGVTHKEHLKRLRNEVDVLTLTATPIPRTLYMALTGVRDISTINTPPEERLPITTHVGPFSPRLVRQAVLRELERGGQVFFVHNRVQTIPAMCRHLKNLTPEARIGIAHGQMHEHELARVMHEFSNGEIDILLCTSIIESGLDIPNANTLIVDRADTFGLAQLYQLRGRVGRGAQRAYAYFFRHRRKMPTPEGEERLEVIAENSQLGAGYSIAMRDLEMRGAGEMLGNRQHGYINAVGFHLYSRMLAQAVREIRSQTGLPASSSTSFPLSEIQLPVGVDLPLVVGIPEKYVEDQKVRLQLYRRIADINNEGELSNMVDEFKDRFGSVPEEVQGLFFQIRVKILAELSGLSSINREGDQIVLRYPPLPEGINSRNLPNLGPNVRTGKNAYWIPFNNGDSSWQGRLLDLLRTIEKMSLFEKT